MMRIFAWLSGAALFGAAACGGPDPAGDTIPTAVGEGAAAQSDGACPMSGMGDVSVLAVDTETGVHLDFTIEGDPADLRARVQKMVAMHDKIHGEHGSAGGQGSAMHGEPDSSGGHATHGHGEPSAEQDHSTHGRGDAEGHSIPEGMGMHGGDGDTPHAGLVPARAVYEDLDGGARIVLTPEDPAQRDALREHARAMAEHLAAADCPMGHTANEPEHHGDEGHSMPSPSPGDEHHGR